MNLDSEVAIGAAIGVLIILVLLTRKHEWMRKSVVRVFSQWEGILYTLTILFVIASIAFLLKSTGVAFYLTNSRYTFGVISKMQVEQSEYGEKGLTKWYEAAMK